MITIGETLITEGLMKSDMIREKVISSLKKGKFSPIGAFGIFEPQNPENLYEIISLNELRKLPYRKGIRYGVFSAVSEKSLVLENSCYDQLLHGKVPGGAVQIPLPRVMILRHPQLACVG